MRASQTRECQWPDLSALVRIVGESQSHIAAYASRIHNSTSDGATLRAFRLPAQGTVP